MKFNVDRISKNIYNVYEEKAREVLAMRKRRKPWVAFSLPLLSSGWLLGMSSWPEGGGAPPATVAPLSFFYFFISSLKIQLYIIKVATRANLVSVIFLTGD